MEKILAQYEASLAPAQQTQFARSRYFLARFIYHLYPGLPSVPDRQYLDEWFSQVSGHILADTRRLLDALQDSDLPDRLGVRPSSMRSYRHRLRPFFKWYANQRAGCGTPPGLLSTAWEELLKHALFGKKVSQQKKLKVYLRKFALFASGKNIEPDGVDATLIRQYHHWLLEKSGLSEPHRPYNALQFMWQLLAQQGRVPQVTFYKPALRESYSLSVAQMPATFKEVYEDYERCLRSHDPDDWPTHDPQRSQPFAEATIGPYLKYLRDVDPSVRRVNLLAWVARETVSPVHAHFQIGQCQKRVRQTHHVSRYGYRCKSMLNPVT